MVKWCGGDGDGDEMQVCSKQPFFVRNGNNDECKCCGTVVLACVRSWWCNVGSCGISHNGNVGMVVVVV